MMRTDIERPVISYRNTSKCYRITEKEQENSFINRQYFSTYRVRLSALRERVLIAAKKAGIHNYKSLEALPDGGECLIIGTIIKRIGLRPSILKELAHDEHLIPEDDMPETADDNIPEIRSLVSHQDYLEMEDDKQLIKIVGVDMNVVATGCVIGIFGQKGKDDSFVAKEIIWPAAETQLEWPLEKPKGKIAILSGLEITGDPETDKGTLMKLAAFTRWFTGVLTDNKENKELVASVERILIVGDSIFLNGNREISSAVRNLRLIPKDVNIPTFEAVEQLDRHLCHLTSKMQVDIIPGVGDPATQLWPQQPIHRTCLPKASVSGKALGLRTNPYSFILGDIDIIATSGHNVEDILRMSTVGDSLKVMESILNWQHIAPTAPDTLDAFPMDQRDPLIMQRRPHVLICGNQGQSSKKWVETDDGKTLLITVSKFSKTGDVQILDLNSMEVDTQRFDFIS